jgi:hypothetical protein
MTNNNKWLPMDTAPRDGTKVLVATINGGMYIVHWDDYFQWCDEDNNDLRAESAIAWMPLPPSPTAEGDA